MSIPRISPHNPPALEQWPANRTHFELNAGKAALLVHDLQQYFLDHFDRQQEPITSMLSNAQELLEACRGTGLPVLYTCQPCEQPAAQRGLLNEMWGPGIATAPDRVAVEPCVAPHQDDALITKWRYSAFQRTPLLGHLQHAGCKQLIVCGVYAHIGCLATAFEAFMHDIEVFFVADAMADFSQQKHQQALDCVANCCGTVLSTRQVIALLEKAQPAWSAPPVAPAAQPNPPPQ